MILRWFPSSVITGLIYAAFHYLLDPFLDHALLRSLEIAAIFVLGATLATTGAAIGAGWISVESKVLDVWLYIQLITLFFSTFRLLEGIIDGTLLRGLVSAAIVMMGGWLVSVVGRALARRFLR